MSNHRVVVVYGPAGSGKTRHAAALARHYGCANILDGCESVSAASIRHAAHRGGVLVLQLHRCPGGIPIADALQVAGLAAGRA